MADAGFTRTRLTEPAGAFETFILRDLVGFVDRTFQTRATREGRVIGGLSMGGFGAIKLALKHPEMFCAAASHSGALWRPHGTGAVYEGSELHRVFGDEPGGRARRYFRVGRTLQQETQLPALRFDCGTEDYLLEANRAFHAHLQRLGIAHEYAEYPGRHDWAYWDEHVQEAVVFLAARPWGYEAG